MPDRVRMRHSAALAQLGLSDEQLDDVARWIDAALEKLPPGTAPLDDASPAPGDPSATPTADIGGVHDRQPRLRPDLPRQEPLLEPLADLAPEWQDDYFTAPSEEPGG